MRIVFRVLVGAWSLAGWASTPKMPDFSRYPATTTYSGPIHPVVLSSDKYERQFRTQLRNGIKRGVNFAGEYVVVSWGCGSSCVENAVVSAKTGKVCDWFESCGDDHFRKNSRLIILNPPDGTDHGLCTPGALVWNGKKLEEIKLDSQK